MLTLPRALWVAAERRAEAGFTFLAHDGSRMALPFSDLAERVRGAAQALVERGVEKGSRIALILSAGQEFVVSFLAAIAAGAVAVPMYPPSALGQLGPAFLAHLAYTLGASRSRFLVTSDAIRTSLAALGAGGATERAFVFSDLASGDASLYREPEVSPDDTALIQFTSGSTARPKGVVLSHVNLASNAKAINDSLELTPDDAGVSWLPLFHDMGLIGFVIAPLYSWTPVTIMPPMMFLKRPAIWLRTLSEARGTISYAPTFAYSLAMQRISEADMQGVNLSSWRVAGCAAEPINASILRAFAGRFARWGFRAEALAPSYGIAEASLGVTFTRVGRGLCADSVDPTRLWERGSAEPSNAPDRIEIVSCGASFEDHEVRVVSAEPIDGAGEMAPLPERTVGEVVVRGPSVSSGYFEDPEQTKAVIRRGWLLTGDLGYFAGGELHICGRKKDLIIVSGKNYYPQDIEWEAAQVDGVRERGVVAFSARLEGLDREAVVVVVETRSKDQAQAIAGEIKLRVQDAFGLAVDEVVPAMPGAIPKTSSGKVQRARTRALYETGKLRRRDPAPISFAPGPATPFLKLGGRS